MAAPRMAEELIDALSQDERVADRHLQVFDRADNGSGVIDGAGLGEAFSGEFSKSAYSASSPPFDLEHRHPGMGIIYPVFNPISLIKAQAAAAVALAGENVQVAVTVPVHCLSPGNHLWRFALNDDDAF